MRGRVESFRAMLSGGSPPLGYMLAGAVAAVAGPGVALTGGALLCVALVSGLAATRKELRDPYLGSANRPESEPLEAT